MPDIEPHVCGYPDCRHQITLEEWAVAHPDLARQMLAEVPGDSRTAKRLLDVLDPTPTDEGDRA